MTILIAHRGNIDGPNPELENKPCYIESTLLQGYDVEIDLWCFPNYVLYLGHDEPQYPISLEFLRKERLWIHCKNIPALEFCKNNYIQNPYFFHDIDDTTLTSNGLFWTFPGKKLTKYSIAVMPERSLGWLDDKPNIIGICSDFVITFKDY
jgi:hypothetical protein